MRRDNPGELIQIQLVRAAGGERYRLLFIERQIFGNVGRSFNFRVSQGRAECRCLVKRNLRRERRGERQQVKASKNVRRKQHGERKSKTKKNEEEKAKTESEKKT